MSSGEGGVRGKRRWDSKRDKPAPQPPIPPGQGGRRRRAGPAVHHGDCACWRPLPAPGAGPGTLAPLATVAPQPDVRFALGARGAGNGSGSQVLSDGCNETEFDTRCAVSPTPSLSSCPGPGYFGALVRERCR